MAALDLAGRLGQAVRAQQRNLAEAATLATVLGEAGLPAERLTQADTPAVIERYAATTRQTIAAGVFGAPSYVIEGEIFWGQDRPDFVARRVQATVKV